MSFYYFPGCQYSALSPDTTAKITDYLHRRFHMIITGCCRTNHPNLTPEDTAVTVCPTCTVRLLRDAPHAKTVSLWEVLVADQQFPWPDLRQEPVTIQDCADSRGNDAVKLAVRGILRNMNAKVIEVEGPPGAFPFCRPRNDEQTRAVKQLCTHYQTDTVACYCTGCYRALQIGGVRGIHLLDLILCT